MADIAPAPVKELKACERPGCPVRFVPASKNHKYCSSKCKQRVVAYRHALNGGR
jgi:predicted RNA-binding Zn ribbon-like protein